MILVLSTIGVIAALTTTPSTTRAVSSESTSTVPQTKRSKTSTQKSTSTMATASPETKRSTAQFLHLTDLHLSSSRPFSFKNLERFCESVLPHISDSVEFIAITGDFTDGIKDFFGLGKFEQDESDWQMYLDAISKCSVPVLTIRGNHDCFGVHSFEHETNSQFLKSRKFLQKFGQKHFQGSFAFELENARFVFLEEARILPSPHQYHGEFSSDQANWLASFINGPSNHRATKTYVFGHYPLGSLIPDSRDRLLSALSGSFSRVTYLSGHIHSVVGRNGVQALRSHAFVDELQLSDFKWSGVVRKVDIDSGIFVDIPTLNWDPSVVSATLLLDPEIRYGPARQTLLSVHSKSPFTAVHACSDQTLLNHRLLTDNMYLVDVGSTEYLCLQFDDDDQKEVKPTDTRLGDKSLGKLVFSHFFEFLQICLLVLYLCLVLVSRSLFVHQHLLAIPIYFVLSPLIPTTVGEWIFNRKWMAANAVAMLDLHTGEVFLDSETTRVGLTLVMYLFMALAKASSRVVSWVFVCLLIPLVFMDFRLILARGGWRSLLLSPHTWFVLYYCVAPCIRLVKRKRH